MATIDLTAPEVDLPKARELLHKALDLLERTDDAAPPSDAHTLALKVLRAKTLPEAQGLAQALIDAEDQPAPKRRRSNSNSPQRAAHEKAYNDLIEAVRKLLDQLCFPVVSFDAAAKLFAKADMAATPWCARKELRSRTSMDSTRAPFKITASAPQGTCASKHDTDTVDRW